MNFASHCHRAIFQLLRTLRYRHCLQILDRSAHSLIDLGCEDGSFVRAAQRAGFAATGTDIEEEITVTTQSADIITCFEVLEHVVDPVAAMKNLSKRYRRQLIITVPNEPWFSVVRLSWEKEHLWAITPAVLALHLGAPAIQKKIVFGRYHLLMWLRT